MKIAVPKESRENENRVALDPESCKKLIRAGMEISIEAGAGTRAFFPDDEYKKNGVSIVPGITELLGDADFVLKVNSPGPRPDGSHEADLMKPGSMLLASIFPTRNLDAVQKLTERKIGLLHRLHPPHNPRPGHGHPFEPGQYRGYKGVLLGAVELPNYFPMFMTAAGTTLSAKVFVIGAGVAGLQAIATAKRLGASVTATDVRPEVKEQIESVGGKYIGIELQQNTQAGGGYAAELSAEDKARQTRMLADHCAQVDVVITTALIGGVLAPKLLDEAIVKSMKPGSVIVDLGADGGGNCTLSRIGGTIEVGGVKIIAPTNLPSSLPHHASMMFSRNLLNFMMAFWKKDETRFDVDWNDDILKACVVTHDGEVLHGPTLKALQALNSPNA